MTASSVGYDINCGVRLLRTDLTKDEVLLRLKELVNALFGEVPTGVGSHGKIRLTRENEAEPLVKGARWAVEQRMGEPEDLTFIEADGCIPGANPDAVSRKAYERGRDQAGTLGTTSTWKPSTEMATASPSSSPKPSVGCPMPRPLPSNSATFCMSANP